MTSLRLARSAVWVCVLTLCVARPSGETTPKKKYPSPDSFKTLDPPTNLTIDQILIKQLGGIDVAANKILAPGEHILAELDMMLTQKQFLNLYQMPSSDVTLKKTPGRQKRKAARDPLLRWTNAEIPYTFANGHFDKKERFMIKQAMTEWERYTCLKFHPALSADPNTVRLQNGEGCSSQLGMVGGVQTLNLEAPGCRFRGLYLHEIGHAIGLVHEHQRPDRDEHVRILFQNVAPHMRVWFNPYTRQKVNMYDIQYQYSSIMHYGINAFSYNGRAQTIQPLDRSREEEIGNVFTKELAFSDIQTVNLMYNCSDGCPANIRCRNGGIVDQTCRCICSDGSRDCQEERSTKSSDGDICTNIYDDWQCWIWANSGECDRNSRFMSKNCERACELCGSRTEASEEENHFTTWAWQWFGIFTNLVPKDWIIGICKDTYPASKCAKWRQNGDCATNEWWMSRNCKKTCNACSGKETRAETTCVNKHNSVECDEWAVEGECQINPTWMVTNCRRSCQLCHTSDTPDTDDDDVDDGVCEDKHSDKAACERWANKGECEANPVWMLPNCRRSCNKCIDGTCKNVFEDHQCDIWASENECAKNPNWMANNCALSCKKCGSGSETGTGTGTGTDAGSGTETGTETATETGTGTGTGGTDSCRNKHNDVECKTWAMNGHCEINPSWMLENCRNSCKVCHIKPITPEAARCTDQDRGCAGWAKYGFCESNPRYNLLYCKKSCKNCNGCRDEQYLCSVWGRANHCVTNPVYMLRHCQKSCNVCRS